MKKSRLDDNLALFNKGQIGQKLIRSKFLHLTDTKDASYWMIPVTGRLLCFSKNYDIWEAITSKGGICLKMDAELIDVVHSLNSDEHHLVNNLI